MENLTGREIWVYGDLRSEKLFGFSLNVLAKARDLALSISGKASVVLMGSTAGREAYDCSEILSRVPVDIAAEQCINSGADFVYIFENQNLAVPRADVYAKPIADAVRDIKPLLVLFALSGFTRELAARTARVTNTGLIAECAELWIQGKKIVARCPAWGGDIMADITFSDSTKTGFATVQPHAFQTVKVRGKPGTVRRIRVEQVELPDRLKLLSSSPEREDSQKLEDANFVVVGGAGLGSMDNFRLVRELAFALGGEVAATRPPVLQHWVEESRLIGQTGKDVKPNLLFSIGTSGAVQYTAGIREAKTIVAVNRDQNAPIFQVADLGIVADAKTFLPVLTDMVKRATMRKLADALYNEDKDDTSEVFGKTMRNLRETHNWSLETLAEATGQSPEFVERVEKGEVTPSVSFLLRFASALKVDPGTFLRKEEKSMIRNLRSREFIKRTQNYSFQTLSPGAENDHLRAFMITIEPKQALKPVAYKHAGEEFIFVMAGNLKLTIGNKTHDLKPGESIHFNSDIPHKLKSASNETTRCLVVLYTP